jgi:putative SOS response-associated peptidase YedK
VRERRCVIRADGLSAWRKNADGSKAPLWVYRNDGEPFAFAGLWDVWRRGREEFETCTIITIAANDFMRAWRSRKWTERSRPVRSWLK